ncbi:MAG: signal peptidase I [Oscillospiraceae bacterium]|nr:signal peptidase I [Oscillospiraceae bacterium]
MEKQTTSARKEVFSVLRDFSIILAVVTVLFVFAVRLVGVDGSSMYPTLMDKDYMLLLSNVVSQDYDRGDVVVLTVPEFSSSPIVKRIIATEGDLVDIDFSTGDVYVNGERLDEAYISEKIWVQYADATDLPATVPDGCVFVLGDNRNHSADSRYAPIGMVDTRRIMGRVLGIALPGQKTDIEGNVIGGRDFSRIGGIS